MLKVAQHEIFLNDKILLKLRIALNFGKYYALTKQVDSLQIYLRSADNYISSLKYIQNSTENLDYVLLKSEYYNQINRPDSALVYLDMSLISENFHDNTCLDFTSGDLIPEASRVFRPLDRVGVYVPGGKANYPSTVLMAAIPAKVAGVEEVIMTLPAINGQLSDLTLAAARISKSCLLAPSISPLA